MRNHSCRRLALLSYFDEATGICNNCDNCLNPPDVEDYTSEAKLVLTAIKETGQYFGVTHIIDVIRGSETAKVKARSHNRLEVFGSAAAKSKQVFQSIIRQLVASNSIRVNLEKYGALEITEKGMQILYDQERFLARAFSHSTSSTADRGAATSKPEVTTKNTQLLAELKKVRLELARARAVPAFVIFSDKTLIQMAEEMPTTESEFLSISGVGKAKFEEFYESFRQVISEFKFGQR